MPNEKYKIVLDTNIIWTGEKSLSVFSPALTDLIKFIGKYNKLNRTTVVVPEIVLQERIEHVSRGVASFIGNLDTWLKELKSASNITPYKKVKTQGDIVRALEAKARKFLGENKIQIFPVPPIDQSLIERSLRKVKPFSEKGDKGFKDTLIWLSLLRDAKKSKGTRYILCTRNVRDFSLDKLSKEFKKHSSEEFDILSSVKKIEEYMDSKLGLRLELKKRNEEIEREVKSIPGELTVQFNSYIFKNSFTGLAGYWEHQLSVSESNRVVGYDFMGINFMNITEVSKDNFRISADLTVMARYSNPTSTSKASSAGGPLSVSDYFSTTISSTFDAYTTPPRDLEKVFKVVFIYNKKTLKITMKAASEDTFRGDSGVVYA